MAVQTQTIFVWYTNEVYAHTRTRTYMYTHIHTHVRTHTHAHTHMYVHTHIHTLLRDEKVIAIHRISPSNSVGDFSEAFYAESLEKIRFKFFFKFVLEMLPIVNESNQPESRYSTENIVKYI